MSRPSSTSLGRPGSFRLLVVDADPEVAALVRSALEPKNYAVEALTDAGRALDLLATEPYDALLVDLKDGGWEVLDRVKKLRMPPIVFVMSAFADVPSAIEAMRRGAVDYIEKPFKVADLVARVQRAVEGASSRRRVATQGPIAASAKMRAVFDLAERVARTPSSSALVVGESGVGKEIVASRIHEASGRASAPFVRVNLAAIPEAMIEAELFGSARGAFTDAKRDRAGLLASADGGTILLDELTELRPDLQPKLLRVLEERRFFPLGSDKERVIDVRFIAATNRDPVEAIREGKLRHDLYYRISTVLIEVPPLREREEDLMPLAEHFLAWFSAEFGRSIEGFSPEAVMSLHGHEWLGNVRELRNVIERAVILCDGDRIGVKELRLEIPRDPERASSPDLAPRSTRDAERIPTPAGGHLRLGGAKSRAIELVERRQIERALELAGGNRTTAAQLLGISRSTLWEKLKHYGM